MHCSVGGRRPKTPDQSGERPVSSRGRKNFKGPSRRSAITCCHLRETGDPVGVPAFGDVIQSDFHARDDKLPADTLR